MRKTITTADYIDFDRAMYIGTKLLKRDKTALIGRFIIIAINTGLRYSDVIRLTYEDMKGDTMVITEKKTGKRRTININDNIRDIIDRNASGPVFLSQKGTLMGVHRLNTLLREAFSQDAKTMNISTHSLRKSFGRRVWDNNHRSDQALMYLSELFNHSNTAITRKYLGIRQEELGNIYMTL